jgi:hypothetical protein
MDQEESRKPALEIDAEEVMTVSCVPASILTVTVIVRVESLRVMVATGTPVPASVAIVQFEA